MTSSAFATLIRKAVEKKIQKRNNTNLIISVSSVAIEK
jgi:hypothetical protein